MEKPVPADNEILIKVHMTTVNRTDTALQRGIPFFSRLVTGLFKPKELIQGTEFSGVVEAAGKNVSSFKIGDRVFGLDDICSGSHAEYMTIAKDRAVATIPENFSFEEAAAGSEGAHYAYNFINKVDLKRGQKVLVNGATGAIGSAAVQLLKHFGADVTAVCSTKNIELVKSLGADTVIDYLKEDFTESDEKYDYVFDTVGKSSFFKCKNILKPGGIYISSDLGFMAQNLYLPLITSVIKPLMGNKKSVFPDPENSRESIELLKKLIEEEKFKAVIDRKYPLDQIVEAYRYVETGQKTGSVLITVFENNE